MKSVNSKTRSLFAAMCMLIIIGLTLSSCSNGYGCYYGSSGIMESYEYTAPTLHGHCAP